MKYLIFALLFLTISVSTSQAQSKKIEQLRQIELQRFAAMSARDTARLSELLAEDLTYTHSNGLTENKSAHLHNIAAGKIVYQSMQSEKMNIRVKGKAAVITGLVHVVGLYQGNEFDIRLAYTNAYFKEKGKWKLVAWQSGKAD